MAKLNITKTFSFTSSGTHSLTVIPKGVGGTLAIANNSSKSFVVLLSGAVTISVKPFGIARIGILGSPQFTTGIAIRTKGAVKGSFIFQQS